MDLAELSRDSDSSSTSSSSPPLGATSLLAALAGPTVSKPQGHSPTTPHTLHTLEDHTPHTPADDEDGPPYYRIASEPPRGKGRYYASASPRSTRSFASSDFNVLSGSHSLPRLHQPTVVRRPAGRLSFLPPPAQISPSGKSFAIHQPRRRSESSRSEGYTSMESLSRMDFGSTESLARVDLGSMESLGRTCGASSQHRQARPTAWYLGRWKV